MTTGDALHRELEGADRDTALLFSLHLVERLLQVVERESRGHEVRGARDIVDRLWRDVCAGSWITPEDAAVARAWVDERGPDIDREYVARHFDELFFALHEVLTAIMGSDAGAAAASVSGRALQVPWSVVRRRAPRLSVDGVTASSEYCHEVTVQAESLDAIGNMASGLPERAKAARELALQHRLG